MNFNEYAAYYDKLYSDKNYVAETDYLVSLLKLNYDKENCSILDLGCGTGNYSLLLQEKGYQVTGVDRSETMLEAARSKAKKRGTTISFLDGDIRNFNLHKTFDAVIAMFAVMSYQTTNDDLISSFRTIRSHTKQKGIFIFDAWFGPGVLHEKPEDRIKNLELEKDRILRIAHPTVDLINHTVAVDYKILHLHESTLINEVQERHLMRFLFAPEIEMVSTLTGFEVINVHPFMQPSQTPTENDWNVTWVLRAV